MNTKTILVIDDDSAIKRYLSYTLIAAKYQIDVASDGREALTKAKQYKYDLAIVDLVLPGEINGMDVITSLKTISPDTRIIATSAYSGQAFGSQTVKEGADLFITKTLLSEQLMSSVQSLLGKTEFVPEEFFKSASPPQETEKVVFVPQILEKIPKDAIKDIISLGRKIVVKAGKHITVNYTGEIVSVISGLAKCIYENKTILALKKGEAIGEESLLLEYDSKFKIIITAEKDLELLIISKEILDDYFNRNDKSLFTIYQTNVIMSLSKKLRNNFVQIHKQIKTEKNNGKNGKMAKDIFDPDIDIIKLLHL